MSSSGNAFYQQSYGNSAYITENNSQQQRRQTYLNQIQPEMLQAQYPSTAASQYHYTTSSYPSYTPRSGAPPRNYSISTSSYDIDPSSPTSGVHARHYSVSASSCDNDEDTSSPSSVFSSRSHYDSTPCLSPVSPTIQRQLGDQPAKSYFCLVEGCTKTTARAACMVRHVSNVHFKENAERLDCDVQGCPRVGSNGFTRKDKLVEHQREVHHRNIPKRRGTASSRPSRAGVNNDTDEFDDFDAYNRERQMSFFSMDDE